MENKVGMGGMAVVLMLMVGTREGEMGGRGRRVGTRLGMELGTRLGRGDELFYQIS